MNLVVYTAVLGRTDPLRPMPPDMLRGARAVCFTDEPKLRAPGWEIELLPPQDRPCRASRCLKSLSHEVFPEANATLWIDASFQLLVPAVELFEKFPGEWTCFRHTDRARISQEAEEVIRLKLAKPEAVRAQLAEYQSAGFDTDAAPQTVLAEDGLLIRRHTERVRRMNVRWWSEISRHTLRDQLSVNYCAWREGLSIDYLPWLRRNNPVAHYARHHCPVNDH